MNAILSDLINELAAWQNLRQRADNEITRRQIAIQELVRVHASRARGRPPAGAPPCDRFPGAPPACDSRDR